MQTLLHEGSEKIQIPTKKTVSVRLDAVPVPVHNKLKRFRKELIKSKGKMVTLTEAYYEFLKVK